MARRPPDDEPPESIVLGAFNGIRNTVAAERLGPMDLERGINVDIDDAGQLRRRRGYNLLDAAGWHSLRTFSEKVLGVRDGVLSRIREDYSVSAIATIGDALTSYAEVDGHVYFCNATTEGVVDRDDTLAAWGRDDGQGRWLSPVTDPTETLGEVAGKLLGGPRRATCLEPYKGRIYMAVGKTLWATELFLYHFVDRTRNFMQFEHEITLVMAVDNGLYVGTAGGLYFLQGVFGQFKLMHVNDDAVIYGSGQVVPSELVHPNARNQPMPAGTAAVFMTSGGIIAGFENGTCFNLTSGAVVFPQGSSAASLFRQDMGANSYVASVDSGGSPSANARIGDYVDAEIVRHQ